MGGYNPHIGQPCKNEDDLKNENDFKMKTTSIFKNKEYQMNPISKMKTNEKNEAKK